MDLSRQFAISVTTALRGGRRIRNFHDLNLNPRFISNRPAIALATFPRRVSSLNASGLIPMRATVGRKAPLPSRQFSAVGEASSSENPNPTPWKVAIVGSGPSGCYTAKYLLSGAASKLPSSESAVKIDVIERLPTPYGLVRNGVAPDHPEVKNVQNDFDALFESADSSSSIGFYGNVTVGGTEDTSQVALEELRKLYDVVILAYGCESDRELNLPVHVLDQNNSEVPITTSTSDIKGILSAREFVNWYNGHPDYDWVTEKVQQALCKPTQNIVVVGHGNVALDCARILAKSRGSLDPTDLTTRALDVLRPKNNSNDIQRSISVVGRRGHVQAAFTIKEVRELTKLMEDDDAQLIVRKDELELGGKTEASQEELKARPRARIHKLLEGHSQTQLSDTPATEVHLRFLTNPIRFQTTEDLRLSGVVCERTQLEGTIPGSQTATGTGSTEVINADLCLVSIGYKGLPIDASTEESYDASRGTIHNDHGRVTSDKSTDLAPLYVSGWLKRGPSGIIGTNIGDAKDTVVSILEDMKNGVISKSSKSLSLKDLLEERKIRFVDWEAYRRIETCEASNKRHPDQPREKLVDRETLLRAAEA